MSPGPRAWSLATSTAVALSSLLVPAPAVSAALSSTPVTITDADDVLSKLDISSVTFSADAQFLNLTVETYEAAPDTETAFTWLLDTNDDGTHDFQVDAKYDAAAARFSAVASPRTGSPILPAQATRVAPRSLSVKVPLTAIASPATIAQQAISIVDANADGVIQNGELDVAGTDGQGELVLRFAGPDRTATAVTVSEASFFDNEAKAVVLAASDNYPDALAGAPLAAAKGGPLLLTPAGAVDPRVEAEVRRVLPAGRAVYLLGGPAALSDAVATRIAGLGYAVTRFSGANRFETAVEIAVKGLGNPTTLLLSTGTTFTDGLSAGAAAAARKGALLLTDDSTMPAAVADYIDAHQTAQRFAVGGPAAAADPTATKVVGANRYATARLVAEAFFAAPTRIGVATGFEFPDALSGGANMAYVGGPLLLTRTDELPPETLAYLSSKAGSISSGAVYGGRAVVSDSVRTAVATAVK